MKNIIIIGLGLHARHHHYPILERFDIKTGVRIRCIVDLKDQEDVIRKYIKASDLKPEDFFFLDPKYRNMDKIPVDLHKYLLNLHSAEKIDGIIISTEPKSHKVYTLWALKNNIDVLLDKPITAPILDNYNKASAYQIFQDYLEIEKELRKAKSNLVVLAARRRHLGVSLIRNYLEKFITEFQVPLSYIDIYHSEGMWNMPDEFFSRENHPYKYGYGVLLHSGYHFIDMFFWLSKLNSLIESKAPERLEFVLKYTRPYDFLHQIDEKDYQRLYNNHDFSSFFQKSKLEEFKRLGELDINLLCQLKQKDWVITTGMINLLHNSYSKRAWMNLPENTYKNNGRVRHEHLNIQVSHLLNVRAEVFAIGEKNFEMESSQLSPENYHIMIFRNNDLVGGKVFEQHIFKDIMTKEFNGKYYQQSLNGQAKEDIIQNWVLGKPTDSDFYDHKNTVKFMSKIYEYMFEINNGLQHGQDFIVQL